MRGLSHDEHGAERLFFVVREGLVMFQSTEEALARAYYHGQAVATALLVEGHVLLPRAVPTIRTDRGGGSANL